ncbi:hypothetical protein FB45DRAFT_1092922 [Roridomyces roridus]|uniref:Uncharacterized protein n=1 Tax=Roridomyces roridus TaxID=1738132 RepID=A0AAD7BHW7_9AGAR|nr:hypothetical protein FB45DRAFT_1092922 [Roridomyces roridus]
MQSCLRLSALQNLPMSIRRDALAAASGSTENLDRVVAVMTRPENQSQLIFLLPLVFRLIDPARIPSSDPDDQASLTPAETASYHEAMLALDALSRTEDIPPDVAPEVWFRVWQWFLFLELYHTVHEDAALDRLTCSRVILFAGNMERYPGVDHIIRSTPGFYRIVIRAWIAALLMREASTEHMHQSIRLLRSVGPFLADDKLLVKETLEEFIGDHDPSNIAMWALRHGDFVLKLFSADPPLKPHGWLFGLSLLAVLRIVLEVAEKSDLNEVPSRLLGEFVKQNILSFIVHVTFNFANTRIPNKNPISALKQTLSVLQKLFNNKRLYPLVRPTAFIGFVGSVSVGAERLGDSVRDLFGDLKSILSELLPAYTIHFGDGSGKEFASSFVRHDQMPPNQ